MQLRAQCEQRAPRAPRAKRLTRALVCAAAAVPVMLVATGCSSDSGSDSGSGDGKDKAAAESSSASPSASPSPTVRPAAYGKLPEACAVLSKKTREDLVPKADSGKEGTSDDTATRASCSWDSLDDNGVEGSQFRWLSVSLLRFDSDQTRGAGDELAQKYYAKQVGDAKAAEGAQSLKTAPVSGAGDEATAVRYDLKKKEGTFKQQTVVARIENVVVTVDYNGAGLAGDKTPDADDLAKDAQKAAAEVVASVTRANDPSAGGGTASDSPSQKGSASATASATAPASASASTAPVKAG